MSSKSHSAKYERRKYAVFAQHNEDRAPSTGPNPDCYNGRICAGLFAVPLSAVLIGLGSIEFIDQAYARLPQEFGGFRPRRSILHLRSQELPRSLREILLPHAGQTVEPITDSIQVFIFYADHDPLIIKITRDPQKVTLDQLRSMPAHEIRSDVVVAELAPLQLAQLDVHRCPCPVR